MTLVTRARIAGILSLSLLLLGSLSASGALAGAAPPETPAPQTAAIVIGTGSCAGIDACKGAVGPIGNNSCNGTRACSFSEGSVGNDSCLGADACFFAQGNIGDNSCASGILACDSSSNVGNGSCNESAACHGADDSVGNYSCNGIHICEFAVEPVDDCQLNTVAPAACDYQPDAAIRLGSGSYVGDNTYNTDALGQKVFNSGVIDQKLTFFIKIQNDSVAMSDSFKVKRSSGFTNGYRVRYYNAAETDVTGQVTNGSFTTPSLAPGGDYVMRATVKVRSLATLCSFTSRLITVSSVANPNVRDAVRFTAARATPDLNCPPVAVDDEASITENESFVTGNLLANDIDPDGDPMLVVSFTSVAPHYAPFSSVDVNGNYQWVLGNALPAVDALNNGDTLTQVIQYSVSDGSLTSNTATLTITIHGVTDPD